MKFPIKINIKVILTIVIVILFGALLGSISTCNNYKQKNVKLELEKQTFDSIVNKYGQTIVIQEAVIVKTQGEKDQLKAETDSLFNLTKKQERQIKDVVAYYKAITKITIRDKAVPYIDTVATKKWEDSIRRECAEVINYYEQNTISVPRTARDSTSKYIVDMTIRRDSVKVNSIQQIDSQYIRFVTIKGGLLKKDASGKRHLFAKKTIQVQVLHTNNDITVTGQNSAIYIPAKKARWLEKALLIGAGVGTKILIDGL